MSSSSVANRRIAVVSVMAHNSVAQAHRSLPSAIYIPDEWLAEEFILEWSGDFQGTVTAQSEFIFMVLFSCWDVTLTRSVLLPTFPSQPVGRSSREDQLAALLLSLELVLGWGRSHTEGGEKVFKSALPLGTLIILPFDKRKTHIL